ncbi:hypothetical protein ACOME3_003635 [Neoechinorhynchus agilis]
MRVLDFEIDSMTFEHAIPHLMPHLTLDFELMEASQQLEDSRRIRNQCDRRIVFGSLELVPTTPQCPYPAEYSHLARIYVCQYCFAYHASIRSHYRHMEYCNHRNHCPPGKRVYLTNDVAIYELDGRTEHDYCQDLCLLARCFIETKCLWHDLDSFAFYLLFKKIGRQHNFVGYFTKLKIKSDRSHNLNCLMVMPHYQKQGHGTFLVDFSYLLSIMENVPGTPEKPLSPLAVILYNGYWRKAIEQFVYDRTKKGSLNVRIKEICDSTGILAQDVVDTLKTTDLLSNTNLIRVRMGFCELRRLCLPTMNPQCLIANWTPWTRRTEVHNVVRFPLERNEVESVEDKNASIEEAVMIEHDKGIEKSKVEEVNEAEERPETVTEVNVDMELSTETSSPVRKRVSSGSSNTNPKLTKLEQFSTEVASVEVQTIVSPMPISTEPPPSPHQFQRGADVMGLASPMPQIIPPVVRPVLPTHAIYPPNQPMQHSPAQHMMMSPVQPLHSPLYHHPMYMNQAFYEQQYQQQQYASHLVMASYRQPAFYLHNQSHIEQRQQPQPQQLVPYNVYVPQHPQPQYYNSQGAVYPNGQQHIPYPTNSGNMYPASQQTMGGGSTSGGSAYSPHPSQQPSQPPSNFQ